MDTSSIDFINKEEHNKKTMDLEGPANFETAISHTGFGKFNILVVLVSVIGMCCNMLDTSALSFILPSAECDLRLSSSNKGILNAITYADGFSSKTVYLMNHRGRKSVPSSIWFEIEKYRSYEVSRARYLILGPSLSTLLLLLATKIMDDAFDKVDIEGTATYHSYASYIQRPSANGNENCDDIISCAGRGHHLHPDSWADGCNEETGTNYAPLGHPTPNTNLLRMKGFFTYRVGIAHIREFREFTPVPVPGGPEVNDRLSDRDETGGEMVVSPQLIHLTIGFGPFAVLATYVAEVHAAPYRASAVMFLGMAFGAMNLLIPGK
uniref:Uncharacterized protein n=1 Tax=Timema douglasi TaxID=61478 RepID=A0A7R8VKZ8_TIMDO|nr:unnamed protein product [Timema douglasi]